MSELATFAASGCASGCGSGSTIGPDKALYVTDGPTGRVLRVDPDTGAITTFASGLPPAIPEVGIGGAMDVVFLRRVRARHPCRAWSGPARRHRRHLPDRRDGTATAIADIGAWSIEHPPATDFFVPSGVQYAMETFRGGFLVTDGHHNRVLRVPHLPQDGKVVRFTPRSGATEVASGASLIVDVEFGPGRHLYALSQGIWDLPPIPENEGAPASPNTGRLLRVTKDGGFASVVEGLDRPTSVDFIGRTAFVITLTGKVIKIENVGRPHFD